MLQVCFTLFNLQGTQRHRWGVALVDNGFMIAHSTQLVKHFFQKFFGSWWLPLPPSVRGRLSEFRSGEHLPSVSSGFMVFWPALVERCVIIAQEPTLVNSFFEFFLVCGKISAQIQKFLQNYLRKYLTYLSSYGTIHSQQGTLQTERTESRDRVKTAAVPSKQH